MFKSLFAKKSWIIGLGLVGALLVAFALMWIGRLWLDSSNVALAQGTKTYVYSVKFVCSLGQPSPFLTGGTHLTAINIRNFSEEDVTFAMKRIIPESRVNPQGMVSNTVSQALNANHALDLDCVDILGSSRFDSGVFDTTGLGFLVIESPIELEVVAVHSSEAASDWAGAWNKIIYVIDDPSGPGGGPGGGPGDGSDFDLPGDGDNDGDGDGDTSLELWDKIIFVVQGQNAGRPIGSPSATGTDTVVQGEGGSAPPNLPNIGEISELIVKSQPGFSKPAEIVREALEQALGAPLSDGLDIKIISVEFGVGAAAKGDGFDFFPPCEIAIHYILGFLISKSPDMYEIIIPAQKGITTPALTSIVRNAVNNSQMEMGQPPLDSDESVFICDVEFAIGGSTSTDVEYVQPKVVER